MKRRLALLLLALFLHASLADAQTVLNRYSGIEADIGAFTPNQCLVAESATDLGMDACAANVFVYGSTVDLDTYLEVISHNHMTIPIDVTDEGGLNVQWTAGQVQIAAVITDTDARGTDFTLTDNALNYIYATVSGGSTLQVSTTEPTEGGLGEEFTLAARVWTSLADIHYILEEVGSGAELELLHEGTDALHSVIVSGGLVVTEDTDATNANDFTIATGTYFLHGHNKHTVSSPLYSAGAGHGDNNTVRYYHSGGSWTTENANGVDFGFWDDGTNKAAVSASKWYVAWIFIEGASEIEYVYPQTEHNTENAALLEATTYPPSHAGIAVALAAFVMRGSATTFDLVRAYLVDIRPVHGGSTVPARQNLWATITGDAGSTTADSTIDTLYIVGATNLSTTVVGDTVLVTDSLTPSFSTVDTGQGANELYDMDQDVLTTSIAQFGGVDLDDNDELRLGTGNDALIDYDGTDLVVDIAAGTFAIDTAVLDLRDDRLTQGTDGITVTNNNLLPTDAQSRDYAAYSVGQDGIAMVGTWPSFAVVEARGVATLTAASANPFGMTFLFHHDLDYTNAGAYNFGPLYSFRSHPTIIADTTARTISLVPGFWDIPIFETTGGGTLTQSAALPTTSFLSDATINAGVTIGLRYGLHTRDATGSGTLTTQVGIKIDDLTTGGTDWSMQIGSAPSYHTGPMTFGAAAAAAASTALEIQSTTGAVLLPRMTTAQRNALSATDGMIIYNTTTGNIEGREGGAWVNI